MLSLRIVQPVLGAITSVDAPFIRLLVGVIVSLRLPVLLIVKAKPCVKPVVLACGNVIATAAVPVYATTLVVSEERMVSVEVDPEMIRSAGCVDPTVKVPVPGEGLTTTFGLDEVTLTELPPPPDALPPDHIG